MKKVKQLSALLLIAFAFAFGACSQDESLDDLIDSTELNAPGDPDDQDDDDDDLPSGGQANNYLRFN